MRKVVLESFQKGQSVREYATGLDGRQAEGRAIKVTIDPRTTPWLDHLVDGWVDGPPSSNVAAVFSARDPDLDQKWRRFTVTHAGPWHYEIDAFPTPFNNATAPLSPGIPPGASRRHGAGS